jgi:large subunit ribosomal protein L29
MAKAAKKVEDLKGKTPDELQKLLLDTKKEQFNLRFQRTGGQLENTSQIRKIRRNVARINTALSEHRNKTAPKKSKSATAEAKTKATPKTPKTAKAKKTAA